MTTKCKRRVFDDRFPSSLVPLLGLLRRRVRCSREVTDDVVRARGSQQREKACYGIGVTEKKHFDHKRHGTSRGWYANGARYWEISYATDMAHGLERYWHVDGNCMYEMTYVDGIRNGVERRWYMNGMLRSEIPIVANEMHGLARFWDSNGVLLREDLYIHGSLIEK